MYIERGVSRQTDQTPNQRFLFKKIRD